MTSIRIASQSRLRVAGAVMAIAAAALTACGSPDAKNSSGGGNGAEPLQIAYIGTKKLDFQNAIFKGLSSAPGVEATFIESGFDANTQSQALDNAVASGRYKGIVFPPSSTTGLIPAAQRAIDAGIQVVNVAVGLGPDEKSIEVQLKGQAASLAQPWGDYARLGATLALQACEQSGQSPCNIARIGSNPQYAAETSETEAVEQVVAEAGPKAKLVATTFAMGFAPTEGQKAAQDLLVAHPEVNVIIATDQLLQGVEQVVAERGQHVQLVGLTGTRYAMKAVSDGRWFGEVATFPEYMGELAGKTILRHITDPALKGETLDVARPDLPQTYTRENAHLFGGETD